MPDLLCAGGNHASDILAILARVYPGGCETLYDDDPSKHLPPLCEAKRAIIIGINDPQQRRKLAQRYGYLGAAPALVDPSAIIGPNVSLGAGVVIAPLACLLHSVTLDQHVHVNYHASMTRCHIGAYSSVGPGATIAGNVETGEACFIGANSTICERVKIGNNVTVAAGAIVPPYSVIPDDTKIIGVWKGGKCLTERYFLTVERMTAEPLRKS